jgi:hypothetical protein
MRVYLAGPMTNIPQFNFPAFDAAEADLTSRGYDVVPPFDLHDPIVRPRCLASQDGAVDSVPGTTWGYALARDVEIIADHDIEAIVCMKGWERSRGARLEVFVARLLGLPVYAYAPDELYQMSEAKLADVFAAVAGGVA